MSRKFRLLCVLLLVQIGLFSSLNQAIAQIVYRVTELVPVAGYAISESSAINDNGDVVGTSYPPTINWNGMATRWNSTGRATALGIVKNGTFSFASSINRNGLVVGEGDNGRPNAVVFSNGGSSFLTKGTNNSFAVFAADSGSIFGNLLKGFDGVFLPVVWRPDPKKAGQYTFTELKFTDSTGVPAEANLLAANNAGQAVGYGFDASLGQVPLVWNSITQKAKQLPSPNGSYVMPLGMNDSGIIVGQSYHPDSVCYPIIWNGAPTYQAIEMPLFPGETYGSANGINNIGMIIGNHHDLPAVWIAGQIQDVNSSLDASGNGWVIDTLSDINNLGVIVGTGFKNGVKRAVVLTPVAG